MEGLRTKLRWATFSLLDKMSDLSKDILRLDLLVPIDANASLPVSVLPSVKCSCWICCPVAFFDIMMTTREVASRKVLIWFLLGRTP